MKKIIVLIFTTCTFYLSSCSPDNPGSPTTGAVTVKYEIILPGPIIPPVSPASYNIIVYTNETAQVASLMNDFISGNRWSKTITVTETRRPLTIQLLGSFPYTFCNTIGPIISNIYIDNVLKATLTAQPLNGNNNSQTGSLIHILQ